MSSRKVIFKSGSAALVVAGIQVGFYLVLLSLLSSSQYALEEFSLYKYYIVSLALGFGAQIGLFIYLRSSVKGKGCSKKVLLISGATSTTSMVSCCALHLASILPIIGASGVISTLGQYQTSLYWVGLAFNLFGLAFIASRLLKLRRIARKSTIAISVVAVIGLSLLAVSCSSGQSSADNGPTGLQPQTNQDGSVTVTVTPQGIPDAASWDFEMAFDTHTADLSEDLNQNAVLEVDGKEYKPVAWDVEDRGMMGMHLRGVLKFSPMSAKPTTVTLKIRNIGGIDERIFSWNL